jgi:hypothetical protein
MNNDNHDGRDLRRSWLKAATSAVEMRNELVGMPRWMVDIDSNDMAVIKDLGEVLNGPMLAPNGLGVALLESSSYNPKDTSYCNGKPEQRVVVWPDQGYLRVSVQDLGYRRTRSTGLQALFNDGLLPAVLTGELFDRLVTALRAGVELPDRRHSWLSLWAPSYEELLARLALVQWVGMDPRPAPEELVISRQRELLWINGEPDDYEGMTLWVDGRDDEAVKIHPRSRADDELELLKYFDLKPDGVDFAVVARQGSDGIELHRVREGLCSSAEELHSLGAFDWLPCALTPQSYQHMVDEAMSILCFGDFPFREGVTWHGQSLAEIRAALRGAARAQLTGRC